MRILLASPLLLLSLSVPESSAFISSYKRHALINKFHKSEMKMSAADAKTTPNTCPKTGNPLPSLPLPPPILSDTPGTWAYDTMSRRVDSEILQRTYEENESEFNSPPFASALSKFNALRAELQSASDTPLRHLHPLPSDVTDPKRILEQSQWHDILAPYIHDDETSSSKTETWLTAPWMVTEFYVYRRLMEALDYFNPSSLTYQYDPFAKQKRAGLESSVNSAEAVMAKIVELPKSKEGVALAAAFALWGNKMDLSIWPADSAGNDVDVFSGILKSAGDNLLHDDTDVLASHCDTLRLKNGGAGGMVDVIVDNAGFELVMDLALADHLVESGVAKTVTFQLKSHPTFVSDAMEKDLIETVEYYAALDGDKYPSAKAAGERWKVYLEKGQWKCHEDSFWVQPNAMWEMHAPLREDMKNRCDLAFVKGDANYRRLLGDLYWEYTAPFQDVVGAYFPCPVCALRTFKAEIGCGMDKEQVERAKSLDENWLVNGRFGVVHFGTGATN